MILVFLRLLLCWYRRHVSDFMY